MRCRIVNGKQETDEDDENRRWITWKILHKSHQPASLMHRCFTSKRRNLLVKTFTTYVRRVLEYNSPVRLPTLRNDILYTQAMQRMFTKQIPGMTRLIYYSRLKIFNPESSDLRSVRARADLVLEYKNSWSVTREQWCFYHIIHSYVVTLMRCINSVILAQQEKFSLVEWHSPYMRNNLSTSKDFNRSFPNNIYWISAT